MVVTWPSAFSQQRQQNRPGPPQVIQPEDPQILRRELKKRKKPTTTLLMQILKLSMKTKSSS